MFFNMQLLLFSLIYSLYYININIKKSSFINLTWEGHLFGDYSRKNKTDD